MLTIAQVHTNLFSLNASCRSLSRFSSTTRVEISRHFTTIHRAVKTGQPGLRTHGTAANNCLTNRILTKSLLSQPDPAASGQHRQRHNGNACSQMHGEINDMQMGVMTQRQQH